MLAATSICAALVFRLVKRNDKDGLPVAVSTGVECGLSLYALGNVNCKLDAVIAKCAGRLCAIYRSATVAAENGSRCLLARLNRNRAGVEIHGFASMEKRGISVEGGSCRREGCDSGGRNNC